MQSLRHLMHIQPPPPSLLEQRTLDLSQRVSLIPRYDAPFVCPLRAS